MPSQSARVEIVIITIYGQLLPYMDEWNAFPERPHDHFKHVAKDAHVRRPLPPGRDLVEVDEGPAGVWLG